MIALVGACASKPDGRSRTTPGPGTGPGVGTSAGAGAGVPGPSVVGVRPYSADGELTVKVADVARGECWTTSIAAPVKGAYRCFRGDAILDPCFAPPQPSTPVQLACLAAPWAPAVVLTVSGTLPAPAGGADQRPWAIELATGVRCVASTGTVSAVRGVDLGYHCTDGGNAAVRDDGTGADYARAYYAGADNAAAGASSLRSVALTTIWWA